MEGEGSEADWSDITAPALDDLERLARAALAALPLPYRQAAAQVQLRIADFASDEMLDELDLNDPYELTGLYVGIPLTEKSVMDQPHGPDTIWLFRRPLLEEWAERGDIALGDLVTHVLVHEIAHHFGWSDDEISAIDRWWE
jgi:predicted Zn-dependent protease with MMP-like domain